MYFVSSQVTRDRHETQQKMLFHVMCSKFYPTVWSVIEQACWHKINSCGTADLEFFLDKTVRYWSTRNNIQSHTKGTCAGATAFRRTAALYWADLHFHLLCKNNGGIWRWLTMQQHIPEGAALQRQTCQPRGVVLPHTQPQVLSALQPPRVPFFQLQTQTQLMLSTENSMYLYLFVEEKRTSTR